MGLFNNLFKKETEAPVSAQPQAQNHTQTSTSDVTMTNVEYSSTGLLNLTKNSVLDLTKYSDSLNKIRVAAGWDINKGIGSDYDLDLCAYLLDDRKKILKTVYYGSKKHTGIFLDGDNLTGEGDGDDENIYVNLKEIPEKVESIVFGVVIYGADSKRQKFENVKNAFVRLVDEDSRGKEICRYELSENGGDNTAVTFAKLYKTNGNWSFGAIGNYSKDSIESLGYHL